MLALKCWWNTYQTKSNKKRRYTQSFLSFESNPRTKRSKRKIIRRRIRRRSGWCVSAVVHCPGHVHYCRLSGILPACWLSKIVGKPNCVTAVCHDLSVQSPFTTVTTGMEKQESLDNFDHFVEPVFATFYIKERCLVESLDG